MYNLLLIPLLLGVGILLRKRQLLPESTPKILNWVVTFLALPATTLRTLHELQLSIGLLYPVAAIWIVFLVAALGIGSLGAIRKWSYAKTGCLILVAGLGNTSFVGFPLLESLLGTSSLSTAVLVDQAGSFLILSTLGIIIASFYSGQKNTSERKSILTRIVTFPPFIATVVSIVLRPVPFPVELLQVLDKLGALLIPLALLSVGFQLRWDHATIRSNRSSVAIGLTYKLLLAPLMIFLFLQTTVGVRSLASYVTILEAGMGPMITAAIIATDYGLDAELAGAMLSIGIPLSIVTVPILLQLIS